MSRNSKISKTTKLEVEVVKSIGERIGYGHLMTIASALWRKSLKEKDCPISGAFVPTCIDFLEKESRASAESIIRLYDEIINQALKQ